MKIFSVFDPKFENDIYELIKSMFLDIEISEDVINNNLNELNKILNVVLMIESILINNYDIQHKKVTLKIVYLNLKEILENKLMSPIVIQRMVEYKNYKNILTKSFIYQNDEEFEMEIIKARKFNKIFQNCKNKLIIDASWKSGRKIRNFVKNIIKINPNDLENPNLNLKEYEEISPNIYRNDFILFKIYSI
ncbi:hypothetical protein DMUE_3160 [Dictyocoela muelleri]|nr:hypothetical protein DMUE_3160 [Dictyocoela muelleri]